SPPIGHFPEDHWWRLLNAAPAHRLGRRSLGRAGHGVRRAVAAPVYVIRRHFAGGAPTRRCERGGMLGIPERGETHELDVAREIDDGAELLLTKLVCHRQTGAEPKVPGREKQVLYGWPDRRREASPSDRLVRCIPPTAAPGVIDAHEHHGGHLVHVHGQMAGGPVAGAVIVLGRTSPGAHP